MVGQSLIHYQITAKVGEGGMGEVYQATDTKLDRQVAIKVLPKSFSMDPERLARFEREAKALAQLSHSNIATVHGFDQSDGQWFIAMELLEGDDLAERLKRGPLPVDEALSVCRQVAEALEAAHAKGIIHRDLKPGNIKFDSDGNVKVLDFGLAKLGEESSSSGHFRSSDPSCNRVGECDPGDLDSPTLTADHTVPGTLLGTAAYMSPEQARGKVVDKRSDIWSFGCVLFECIAGNRLFQGEDVTETLASIIKDEPDWNLLPRTTPTTTRLLLRKCLMKSRKSRLRDIGDAVVDLDFSVSGIDSQELDAGSLDRTTGRSRRLTPFLGIVGLAVTLLLGLCVGWFFGDRTKSETHPTSIQRLSVETGTEDLLLDSNTTAVRFAPDGKKVGFMATRGGVEMPRIYLRRLDELRATPVPETEGVDQFCFSPDGKSIAFRDQRVNRLKTVTISGGGVTTICDLDSSYGLDWSDDNRLVFARTWGEIMQVPAKGGKPVALTELKDGEMTHRWPQMLPGGGGVVYTAHRGKGAWSAANIYLERFSSGDRLRLSEQGTHGRLVGRGRAAFLAFGNLYGVEFDPDGGQDSVSKTSVRLVENVSSAFGGAAHFDFSVNGDLIYLEQDQSGSLFSLEWISRDGQKTEVLPPGRIEQFRLSPNGKALVYELDSDIWIYDAVRDTRTKLTSNPRARDLFPVWSSSGQGVFFSRVESLELGFVLYYKPVDGSREEQLLYRDPNFRFPWAVHPDGAQLSVYVETKEGQGDQMILDLEGNDEEGWEVVGNRKFLASEFNDVDSSFSPQGDWVAFSSDESEKQQIYVRGVQEGSAARQVSVESQASRHPRWSMATNELVFATQQSVFQVPWSAGSFIEMQIYTSKYSIEGNSFLTEPPVPWKDGLSVGRYELHPDGQKILVRKPFDDGSSRSGQHIVLFKNFDLFVRDQLISAQ